MNGRQRPGDWWMHGPELVGVLLIAVGVLYFLGAANVVRISWDAVWPLIIVALGIIVLVQAVRPRAGTAWARSACRRTASSSWSWT